MLPSHADVVVVGAGPTGLALAIALRQAGIAPLVLEKLASGQNTSRAAVIHAHTLEVLAQLGVADALIEAGMHLSRFAVRDRDSSLVQLRFDQLPSPYPGLLMIPQHVTERVLLAHLESLGGGVQWNAEVTSIVQEGEGATVQVLHEGAIHSVTARYVVGADGMHSVVRQQAGIQFAGEAFPESFVLADVRMDWPLPLDEVSLYFAPAGLLVIAPLPGGSVRIVATLENAPEKPSAADIEQILVTRGPGKGLIRVNDVVWSSRFRVQHRVASTYRQGRLLVMGDAAHVHSPAGGQGMNTGLVDAVVLGQLLGSILQGRRPEADISRYEDLRRPAAVEVVGMAERLTGLATLRNPIGRFGRNLALRLLDRLPMVKSRLALVLSGLSRRAMSQLDS